MCYSDALYGNLDDGRSQGGYLIFFSDGQGNRNLVSCQTRRVKRVAKSTLAAEALALVDAALSVLGSSCIGCYAPSNYQRSTWRTGDSSPSSATLIIAR